MILIDRIGPMIIANSAILFTTHSRSLSCVGVDGLFSSFKVYTIFLASLLMH